MWNKPLASPFQPLANTFVHFHFSEDFSLFWLKTVLFLWKRNKSCCNSCCSVIFLTKKAAVSAVLCYFPDGKSCCAVLQYLPTVQQTYFSYVLFVRLTIKSFLSLRDRIWLSIERTSLDRTALCKEVRSSPPCNGLRSHPKSTTRETSPHSSAMLSLALRWFWLRLSFGGAMTFP